MPYTIQEGKLAVQISGDRSVNILTLEGEQGKALHLVISRDELLPDEDLKASVDRQIKQASRQMQAFKEIERQEQRIGPVALPGIVLQTHFKQSRQSIYQRQAAIELPGRKVLVFTLNSPTPFDAEQQAQWQGLLDGFAPASEVVPPAANDACGEDPSAN